MVLKKVTLVSQVDGTHQSEKVEWQSQAACAVRSSVERKRISESHSVVQPLLYVAQHCLQLGDLSLFPCLPQKQSFFFFF